MLTKDGVSCFHVAVFPLCLIFEVIWVDMWSVFNEFAGYTHLLLLLLLLFLLLLLLFALLVLLLLICHRN